MERTDASFIFIRADCDNPPATDELIANLRACILPRDVAIQDAGSSSNSSGLPSACHGGTDEASAQKEASNSEKSLSTNRKGPESAVELLLT